LRRSGNGGEQANQKSGYEMSFMAADGFDLSICHSASSEEAENCDAHVWCIGVIEEDMDSFNSEGSEVLGDGLIPDAFVDTYKTFDESEPADEIFPEILIEFGTKVDYTVMDHLLDEQSDWTKEEVAM
jgi:hypothetical protein